MEFPKTRFVIRLKNDISQKHFLVNRFLNELADFAGVYEEEFTELKIRKGCTVIEGYMNRAAIERLHDFFEYLKTNQPDSDELKKLQLIINYFKVEVMIDDPASNKTSEFEPANQNKKVIVLVHGWGGDKDSTFGNLSEFLKEKLNIDIETYPYPSGWLKRSPSVAFIARNLDNWIRNNCQNCEVGILGHSLGGLVTRYLAVIQKHRRIPIPIKLVTLAASPTNGAHLASIASNIPFFNSSQIEELRPNSGFLVDLNERWSFWCKANIPHACSLVTLYALNDMVVSYTSAIGGDSEAVPIYGEDHTSIVKPNSNDSEVVQTITRYAKEAGLFID
ncbi:esterase/lipase family protein [Thalassotalea marina]|uniref:DUF676 domain-containing protein n=1 Tax=Thalassotalea marina TaxID=1673741 RepID=A0A919BRR4_9GAMM|nr:alpha/beta hydrolase [Thalassotalea marina]GHG08125.1 hypothetical protein GCM10017161_42360 [Thalassotalea marina]